MSIIKGRCDRCGKVFNGECLERDYDGNDLCQKCIMIDELREKVSELKNKEDWLKNTHLKEVDNLKQQILILEERINSID